MSIGYACLTIGVVGGELKTCTMKNADPSRLQVLITHNLNALELVLEYNIKHQIKLFRISSDIIPFGSKKEVLFNWQKEFWEKLQNLGNKIRKAGMRVSMHPGQYTVLNSPDDEIVSRAKADLKYHCDFLDLMGLGSENKLILHIGGIYKSKKEATDRFIKNYESLEPAIKKRLVIENDDRCYTIEDVWQIGNETNIPVVFDNLHHQLNHNEEFDECFWVRKCRETWKYEDGKQKIHYSIQAPFKRNGSHSATIKLAEFLDYYNQIDGSQLDIMLEVKDKNLSAIKCINGTSIVTARTLEEEWSRYKYKVLEQSPEIYKQIRQLLKDKNPKECLAFYSFIEEALGLRENKGYIINAAQHVWGYFKNQATESEKKEFHKRLKNYHLEKCNLNVVKNYLWKLTMKYQQSYLLNSYYFFLDEK